MRKQVVRSGEGGKQDFEWGSATWLHGAEVSGSEELTFGEVRFKPGQGNPVHSHPNCEEVLIVLSGDVEHTLGDGPSYRLKPGDSIWIPRGVRHNATCVGKQEAVTLVAFSSAHRKVNGE